ncbi:MAG: type II toxin-antitoxin system Phd/YefM family antitoxin [Candidatus Acidiferrales bacterium]
MFGGCNDLMKVSVAEAQKKLGELIRAVECGEHVTICRRGKPVVDIVPATKWGKRNRSLTVSKAK